MNIKESFGYKCAWLAVRMESPQVVAEALTLRDLRPAGWDEGVRAATADNPVAGSARVFVSPPIDGWIFCVGAGLLAFVDDAQFAAWQRTIAEISASLGTEVQFFATHRVVEAHAWIRALPSGLTRAYAYIGESGETLADYGGQSEEERELGFTFFDNNSPEADNDAYWEREDLTYPDEECVIRLAEKWSVNPLTLVEYDMPDAPGLIGQFGTPLQTERMSTTPKMKKPWWKFW